MTLQDKNERANCVRGETDPFDCIKLKTNVYENTPFKENEQINILIIHVTLQRLFARIQFEKILVGQVREMA